MYQIEWKGEIITGTYSELTKKMEGYLGVPIIKWTSQ